MTHWHVTIKLKGNGYLRFHTEGINNVENIIEANDWRDEEIARISIVQVDKKDCDKRKPSPTLNVYEEYP